MSAAALGRAPSYDNAGSKSTGFDAELERAMRDSMLEQYRVPEPGEPLTTSELQRSGLFYELQAPGSDTCGLNALNNLCQRQLFRLEDLQRAEAEHAQAQVGGRFSELAETRAPTGFFDVEALKLAASSVDLEIVDVEPTADFRKSACLGFVESARQSQDGSFFLGFLVYDRQAMHYYTLRRDERYAEGIWLKFDSQSADSGQELRNRRLTDSELWGLYGASAYQFQSWLLRWYPVIYRAGAAKELRRCLSASPGAYDIEDARARVMLGKSSWLVQRTAEHMLKDLPQQVIRELLVTFARPSEAEMRRALESADWDVSAAQPAIDQLLRQRILSAQSADTDDRPRRALNVCGWDPIKAATLLSLQLQSGTSADAFVELHEALELAGSNVDRAEAVIELLPTVGNIKAAATLLEETRIWSVPAAQRVLEIRKRCPHMAAAVALELLRRNDDDPHAACEMLGEYEKRVQRVVLDNAPEGLFEGEELAIAAAALNSSDWDPSVAFVAAKNLTHALLQTRKLIRSRAPGNQFFPADVILPALAGSNMKPHHAASNLLGMQVRPVDKATGLPIPAPGHAPDKRQAAAPPEEDDSCSVM